jgi:replication factor C small subunit
MENKNFMINDHGLLNEKYRPQTLETFVGNQSLKDQLQKFIDENDITNLLFYGPAGCGKTTLARLIVSNIECDYLMMNASDERGIEAIREKVKGFASTMSFKPLKVVILDEADFLTIQAQASLRNVIEEFSRTTRFIMTCNFVDRIIDPLQSRCLALKVIPPSLKDVGWHVRDILNEEKIEYQLEDIAVTVKKHYPDMRKILNTLQLASKGGVLKMDQDISISSNYMNLILKELKKSPPKIRDLRKIIIDSNVNDFEGLYRFLFEKTPEYAGDKEGSVIIILNEHLYQSQFRIDKEINIASCLQKIIEIIKPQNL